MVQIKNPDNPQLVSALARGLAVLSCFTARQQELSGKELADLTGLPKPTLFRLLDTLCELGMLRYSSRVSKYVPGVALLNLAAPVLARMTIRQLARPLMQDLADYVNGQVQVLVGYRAGLSFVEIAQGAESKLYRPEVGLPVSISRTASGRAYQCFSEEPECAAYLDALKQSDPERHAWLQDRLLDARKDLAQLGFCRGHGDLYREVSTISVPMLPARDGEFWIFSVSVPVFSEHSQHFHDDIGPRLISLVRSVEASLGSLV